jgi:para-aminobenzoate synthetase/4-amino-4-deoxychorismate lyase
VKFLLKPNGAFTIESADLPKKTSFRIRLYRATDSQDPLLYYKTGLRSWRNRIQSELKENNFDECIFVNEKDQLTEGIYTNYIFKIHSKWLTPSKESGLLPGIFRQRLLKSGRVSETVLYESDLNTAECIIAINSLRGFVRCNLVDSA